MNTHKSIENLNPRASEFIHQSGHFFRLLQSNGAMPAAVGHSPYLKFWWLRDSGRVIDVATQLGLVDVTENYFKMAQPVILESLKTERKILTRYHFGGEFPKDDWSRKEQNDGPGIMAMALMGYLERNHLPQEPYQPLIDALSQYIKGHWMKPCNDLWEEKDGLWLFTMAACFAGLKAMGDPEAEKIQAELHRKLDEGDYEVDASLIPCVTVFKAISLERFQPALEKIEAKLVGPGGGVYRNEADKYHGGGQWHITTAWLADLYRMMGRTKDAIRLMNWILAHVDPLFRLGEQDNTYCRNPAERAVWEAKDGKPAPWLIWSHAETVRTLLNLGV